jgi:hypothetical protein
MTKFEIIKFNLTMDFESGRLYWKKQFLLYTQKGFVSIGCLVQSNCRGEDIRPEDGGGNPSQKV